MIERVKDDAAQTGEASPAGAGRDQSATASGDAMDRLAAAYLDLWDRNVSALALCRHDPGRAGGASPKASS